MNEKPRLYARLDCESGSDHLLVCFNTYGNPAQGHRTRLDNFGWLSGLGVATLWFAEAGPRAWYTGFDREIHRWIVETAERQRIGRITLLGSSCAGYASLRHALLLTASAAPLDVEAIAINPQTGFGDALLRRLRDDLERSGWSGAELGADPILPDPAVLCSATASMPSSDLIDLAASIGAAAVPPRLRVYYDALNPIEQGFSGRLAPLPGIALQPHRLGLTHTEGALWFWQSATLQGHVTRRLARGGTDADVAPVNLERTRLLQRHACRAAARVASRAA